MIEHDSSNDNNETPEVEMEDNIQKSSKMKRNDLSPVAKFDLSNKKLIAFEDLKSFDNLGKSKPFPTFSSKDNYDSEEYSSDNSKTPEVDAKAAAALSLSAFSIKVSSSAQRKTSMKFKSKAMNSIYPKELKSSRSQPRKISAISVKKKLTASHDPSHIEIINKAKARGMPQDSKPSKIAKNSDFKTIQAEDALPK